MQPFAVIGKPNSNHRLPPKPVSWSSRHRTEVQVQEINQPKARMVDSNSSSNISHNNETEKGSPANPRPQRSHIIDMNKHSLLCFKVGEGNDNGTFRQGKGTAKTQYRIEDANSPTKQFQNYFHPQQPNQDTYIEKEYAIRLQGFEQTSPKEQRYSYTRRLLNDIGYEDTNDIRPFNGEQNESRGEEVIIASENECVEGGMFQKLLRGLGTFEKEKQYTNEVVLTKKEQRVLKMGEPEGCPAPKMDASASLMLASMQPSPNNLQDYVVPSESRMSKESGSSRRRHPIFTNSKAEYFEDSSKQPYDNTSGNLINKDNQKSFQEMEQSEVTPMRHSLRNQLRSSNQSGESPHKRQKIFQESRNESRSIQFGQLQESSDPGEPKFKRSLDSNISNQGFSKVGGENSSGYTRNLIFQGCEQKNEEQGEVKKQRRELVGSIPMVH